MIASPQVDHQVVYQCAVCVKKILREHEEEDLPLGNLGLCLANLLGLVQVYKGVPTHLWNILQLITEIMKLISSEAVLSNLSYIITNIEVLVDLKDNQ